MPEVTDLRIVLGDAIRAERSRRGISQETLGRRLGWSRQVITSIEGGDRPVAVHEIPAICRALAGDGEPVTMRRLLLDADPGDRAAFDL